MTNPNEKAASIRAKLKFPDLKSFVERYAPNVSTAGIFVKTPTPRPVGTRVKFEFLIADGSAVMRGLGQVAWVRETEADDRPIGMGIKFIKLDAASRAVLDRIIDFKHSLGGPPTPSRYSEVPPPYVPEGMDVDDEDEAPPAAAPPREEPTPAPPPTPAIVPPPPPAAPAPAAEAVPKKRHRPKPADMDLSAIDSMLADLAAPPVDVARKRRPARGAVSVPPPATHAIAVALTEPSPPPPAEEPSPPPPAEEPPPPPAEEPPPPPAAEFEAAELNLDSALDEARSSDEDVREQLREELEALEGPPPVVLKRPAPTEGERAAGEIRNLIADELESGDLVDLLEPEEMRDHLAALSEPPGFAGAADDDEPIPSAPGGLVSFMPAPAREADSLEEDFESVIGGADANGNGEPGSPGAGLDEDSGVMDLGEEAVISGAAGEGSPVAQGDFDIVREDTESNSVVDSLIAEMARDSHEPAGPADLQLLEEEVVSDALDDIFDQASPPETLPDDAVPPGLVRERAPQRPAAGPPPQPQPPPAHGEDTASKKKGFFGKLFGK